MNRSGEYKVFVESENFSYTYKCEAQSRFEALSKFATELETNSIEEFQHINKDVKVTVERVFNL